MYKLVRVNFTADIQESVDSTDISIAKDYVYKCDINVNKGELVVVNSRNGLGIAIVNKVFEDTFENANLANKAKSWVVDVIDISRELGRLAAEERRDYLKAKLQEKKNMMEDYLIYKAIASEDSEAAAMLEELKRLS